MARRFRSAITGKLVTEEYAKANPATTVSEEVSKRSLVGRLRDLLSKFTPKSK